MDAKYSLKVLFGVVAWCCFAMGYVYWHGGEDMLRVMLASARDGWYLDTDTLQGQVGYEVMQGDKAVYVTADHGFWGYAAFWVVCVIRAVLELACFAILVGIPICAFCDLYDWLEKQKKKSDVPSPAIAPEDITSV